MSNNILLFIFLAIVVCKHINFEQWTECAPFYKLIALNFYDYYRAEVLGGN